MWYPLKNSVYSLSAASVILAALLAFSRPDTGLQAQTPAAPSDEHALILAVDRAAEHVVFESAHQKALTTLVLRIAAKALVAEMEANGRAAGAPEANAPPPRGRRQSTMPFFSFANLLPGTVEPST